MSRSVSWRRQCSDAVSWRQDQAESTTIYILRQTGPTGFLLKEEGENKKFKVYIGDPHTCTCPVFTKEKDLCKHICWVLLKKFRVPRQNAVTWQLGLVEREINGMVQGMMARSAAEPSANARRIAREADDNSQQQDNTADGNVAQRPIADDDVCPICQDELLNKHIPVTYCRMGCGNSVHIKCMKVWAEHQKSTGETVVKCPFCREDFGPISRLQEEYRNTSVRQTRAERLCQHLGVTCKRCHVCPVTGKCYRCITCSDYNLCQQCFNQPVHQHHSFEFREKSTQRWRPAQRRIGGGNQLPEAVVNNLMRRDITEEDYDLLLQLDGNSSGAISGLSEETLRSFPVERVRAQSSRLLAAGVQCRVCLQAYSVGQHVRKLPCSHRYHKDCIDNWLLHQQDKCPACGTVLNNSTVRAMRQADRAPRSEQRQETAENTQLRHTQSADSLVLEVPGVGLTTVQAGSTRGNRTTGAPARARHTRHRASQRTAAAIDVRGNSDGELELNMTMQGNPIRGTSINSGQGRHTLRLTSLTTDLSSARNDHYNEADADAREEEQEIVVRQPAIQIPTTHGLFGVRRQLRHVSESNASTSSDGAGGGLRHDGSDDVTQMTVLPPRRWSASTSRDSLPDASSIALSRGVHPHHHDQQQQPGNANYTGEQLQVEGQPRTALMSSTCALAQDSFSNIMTHMENANSTSGRGSGGDGERSDVSVDVRDAPGNVRVTTDAEVILQHPDTSQSRRQSRVQRGEGVGSELEVISGTTSWQQGGGLHGGGCGAEGGTSQRLTGKPPTGDKATASGSGTVSKKGKLRSQPWSGLQSRNRNSSPTLQEDMFVGHDPNSSQGVAANFMLKEKQRVQPVNKKPGRLYKTHNQVNNTSSSDHSKLVEVTPGLSLSGMRVTAAE